MGLLRLSDFSSIPNLRAKIQSRRQQIERYSSTWSEWAAQNFDQVLGNGVVTDGTITTIFTVPAGVTLYITSAYLSIESHSVTQRRADMLETGTQDLVLQVACAGNDSNSNSTNFTQPLIVRQGETIDIVPSVLLADATVVGGFHGFQIPKSLEIV